MTTAEARTLLATYCEMHNNRISEPAFTHWLNAITSREARSTIHKLLQQNDFGSRQHVPTGLLGPPAPPQRLQGQRAGQHRSHIGNRVWGRQGRDLARGGFRPPGKRTGTVSRPRASLLTLFTGGASFLRSREPPTLIFCLRRQASLEVNG